MNGLTLVDLIVALVVGSAVIGALTSRRGVLAALASGLGAAVVCWLVLAAVLVWAPAPARSAVSHSAVIALVPPPVAAVEQGGRLGTDLWHWLDRLPWTSTSAR